MKVHIVVSSNQYGTDVEAFSKLRDAEARAEEIQSEEEFDEENDDCWVESVSVQGGRSANKKDNDDEEDDE